MLKIQVSKIPAQGLEIDERVTAAEMGLDSGPEARPDLSLPDAARLRARAERGEDGAIHIRGRLEAAVGQECARCLAPAPSRIDQEIDLFFLPESDTAPEQDDEQGVELADRDLVVAYYGNDFLDLSAIVREQILLAQPMKRLCREDCRGVCPTCGADRNQTTCSCAPDSAKDSPFRALAALKAAARSES